MEVSLFKNYLIALSEKIGSSQAEQVEALIGAGLSASEAHRFLNFVPVALSRPILERMGIEQFSSTVSIPAGDGRNIDIELDNQPEYCAALAAARNHMEHGTLPDDAFKAVAFSSSDIAVVDEALNAGADVSGAVISTAFVDNELYKHVIVPSKPSDIATPG